MRAARTSDRSTRIVSMSSPYFRENDPNFGRRPFNVNGFENSKVYVGNLAWDVTWQELKDHMRATGGNVMKADIAIDHATGRSKGYGLVTFESARDAQEAIYKLNDTELKGRLIQVREDRDSITAGRDSFRNPSQQFSPPSLFSHAPPPFQHSPQFAQQVIPPQYHHVPQFAPVHVAPYAPAPHFAQQPGPQITGNKLYVGNLSWEVSWQDLKDHLRTGGGTVLSVDIPTAPDGRSKGFAIATFGSARDADDAVRRFNNTDFRGRLLNMREDRDSAGGGHVPHHTEAHGGYMGLPSHAAPQSAPFGGFRPPLPPVPRPAPFTPAYHEKQQSTQYAHHKERDVHQPHGGNNKVFVSNLSYDTTWFELKDFMRTAGGTVLKADVISDNEGRPMGCGVVEFATSRDAQEAISRLNEAELKGRLIHVREDRAVQASSAPQRSRSNSVATVDSAMDSAADSANNDNQNNEGDGRSVSNDSQQESSSGNRFVYVGGLPYDTHWQQLKDHMKLAGHVLKADIVTDDNGRSRGFGIAEFATAEDAARAVANLNGTEVEGRRITVREDRTSGQGPRGGGATSHFQSRSGPSTTRLYVGNLSWDVRWTHLKDLFKTKGNVLRADVSIETKPDGHERSRGFGFVEYGTTEECERAIRELNDFVLLDRKIFVREDRGVNKNFAPPS